MMKLNNKGQALVLFIILFPIIFFLVAFFIENMRITTEKNKLNNIGELAINYATKNIDNEDVKEKTIDLILKNDNKIELKKYLFSEDKIELSLYKRVDGIFGKIIGINSYDLLSYYEAHIENDIFVYTRK